MGNDSRLETLPALSSQQVRYLRHAGINTVEDLADAYHFKDTLLDGLRVPEGPARKQLELELKRRLPPQPKSMLPTFGTGLLFREGPRAKGEPQQIDDEIDKLAIPPEANLVSEAKALGVRHQGFRGTCVAMAATRALELTRGDGIALSPQYLYWRMKQLHGFPQQDGSSANISLNVLENHGCCLESTLPYDMTHYESSGAPIQGPEPHLSAHTEAKKFRTANGLWRHEPPPFFPDTREPDNWGESVKPGLSLLYSLKLAKAALSGATGVSPRPVVGCFRVFRSSNAGPTRRHGRFILPLPGELSETPEGAHAMTIVGYWDDPLQDRDELDPDYWPGGGYLVVQNSWGNEWASESPDGSGFGRIPYAYAHAYMFQVGMPVLVGEEAQLKIGRAAQRGRQAAAAAAAEAVRFCTDCGARLSADQRFCGSCAAAAAAEAVRFCTDCGARLSSDQRFCMSCGSPQQTGESSQGNPEDAAGRSTERSSPASRLDALRARNADRLQRSSLSNDDRLQRLRARSLGRTDDDSQ